MFVFLILKKHDYKTEYSINEFKVRESYNKNSNLYSFSINNGSITYEYLLNNKYSRNRQIINEIKVYNLDDEVCILPISNKIKFYPLCNNTGKIYSYNLSKNQNVDFEFEKVNEIAKSYKNINIHHLNDTAFLIYNYRGFNFINKDDMKDIVLFNKDIYTLNLIYQKDEYLVVPNYDNSYYFNEFYVINIKNGKTKKIDFDFNISFDSVFLGEYKNNIYLLDKKNEKEYRLNLKKSKLEEIELQILKNGKLVKTTYKNILKNISAFNVEKTFKYEVIDQNLYQLINNNKIKISNKKVDIIVKNDNETVYYLSGDQLYMYNNYRGEVLLLSSFEWNFNNTNIIYLYK